MPHLALIPPYSMIMASDIAITVANHKQIAHGANLA